MTHLPGINSNDVVPSEPKFINPFHMTDEHIQQNIRDQFEAMNKPYNDEELAAAMRTQKVSEVARHVVGLLVGISGIAMLFVADWRIGLGSVLLLWSNNISQRR